MTKAELEARILTNLDENGVFYTPDDLGFSTQDGYDEICALTGLIVKSTTITATATGTYYDLRTLVPDFLCVVAIWNNTTKRYLLPVGLRFLESCREDWEMCSSAIEYFWIVNFRYVAFFGQNACTLTLYYIASAPTLASNSTIEIPAEYLKVPIDYSTADLLETQQEFKKAMIYFKEYIEGLERLRSWLKSKQNTGRIGVIG